MQPGLQPARTAGSYLRVAVLHELQYRVNLFLQLVQTVLAVGTSLAVLALVFSHTSDLAGWTRDQLLVVLGLHLLTGGLIQTFVQPNMTRLIEDIRQGTLDFVLTKPVDAQLLVSVREVQFWHLTDVVVGAVLTAIGAIRVGVAGPAEIGLFLLVLVLGAVLIYCAWLALTVGAFWLVRLDFMVELFDGLYQAGRWPISIYPGWLRISFTVLVPLAFAITVPAQALTGRLTPLILGTAAGFTVLVVAFTRWWWRIGLRHYVGASA